MNFCHKKFLQDCKPGSVFNRSAEANRMEANIPLEEALPLPSSAAVPENLGQSSLVFPKKNAFSY